MIKVLAKVTDVRLFIEDHGILTLFVDLDFGGSGQSFGGISLDSYDEDLKRRVGHAIGTDFILQMLSLFQVSSLDKIKGKPVYALKEKEYGEILGLKTPDFDGSTSFILKNWTKKWEEVDEKNRNP